MTWRAAEEKKEKRNMKTRTNERPQSPFWAAVDAAVECKDGAGAADDQLYAKMLVIDPRSRAEVFATLASWVVGGQNGFPFHPNPMFAAARAAVRTTKEKDEEDGAIWLTGLIGRAHNALALSKALNLCTPRPYPSEIIRWPDGGEEHTLAWVTRMGHMRYALKLKSLQNWRDEFRSHGYEAAAISIDMYLTRDRARYVYNQRVEAATPAAPPA